MWVTYKIAMRDLIKYLNSWVISSTKFTCTKIIFRKLVFCKFKQIHYFIEFLLEMQKRWPKWWSFFSKSLNIKDEIGFKKYFTFIRWFRLCESLKNFKSKSIEKNCCINRGYGSLVYVNQGYLLDYLWFFSIQSTATMYNLSTCYLH